MILGIVLLNLVIPSKILASDCGEYCYDKDTAASVVVEIEKCRLIKEQVDLYSSSNEELQKQLDLLGKVNAELREQINLLSSQLEFKDKLMGQQKESYEGLLKEERKKSTSGRIKAFFVGAGAGVLGVVSLLLFL